MEISRRHAVSYKAAAAAARIKTGWSRKLVCWRHLTGAGAFGAKEVSPKDSLSEMIWGHLESTGSVCLIISIGESFMISITTIVVVTRVRSVRRFFFFSFFFFATSWAVVRMMALQKKYQKLNSWNLLFFLFGHFPFSFYSFFFFFRPSGSSLFPPHPHFISSLLTHIFFSLLFQLAFFFIPHPAFAISCSPAPIPPHITALHQSNSNYPSCLRPVYLLRLRFCQLLTLQISLWLCTSSCQTMS